LLLILVPCFFS